MSPLAGKLRSREGWALALVLILAGFLRFWGLPSQGIWSHDEGECLAEGQFIASSVKLLPQALGIAFGDAALKAKLEGLYTLFHDGPRGSIPHLPKPTHAMLTGASMLLLGERDFAGQALNALSGVLTVWLVFLLGRRMFGREVGLLAALALAVSAYHIWYSRAALAEADSIFFFTLATYLYYRSRQPEEGRPLALLFLAGLSVGLAFTTNYRWTVAPLLFWAYEGHLWVAERQRGLREKLARFGLLSLGMALPLLAYELPSLVARILAWLGLFHGLSPTASYFQTLILYSYPLGGQRVGLRLPDLSFPYYLWYNHGYLVSALALVGLVYAARRRSLADIIIVSQMMVIPLYYAILTRPVARHIAISLPAFALLVGVGSERFVHLMPEKRHSMALVALALGLCAFGLSYSLPVLRLRSGYREAIRLIEEAGGPQAKFISTNYGVAAFYTGWRTGRVQRVPGSLEELRERYSEGYAYLLVDGEHIFMSDRYPTTYVGQYLNETILTESRPAFSLPNPIWGYPQSAFEGNNISLTRTLASYRKALAAGSGEIKVYDLAEYFRGG